jgi:hypothetical protein
MEGGEVVDDNGMDWDWYYQERQSEKETPEDLWDREFREIERGDRDYDVE